MAAEPVGASGLMTPWEIKQILSHAVCEMAIVPPSLSSSFISFSMLFLFTLQFWLYFSLPMSTSVIRSHHRFKTQTSTTFSSIPSYFLSLPNLPSAPLSRIWRYRRRGWSLMCESCPLPAEKAGWRDGISVGWPRDHQTPGFFPFILGLNVDKRFVPVCVCVYMREEALFFANSLIVTSCFCTVSVWLQHYWFSLHVDSFLVCLFILLPLLSVLRHHCLLPRATALSGRWPLFSHFQHQEALWGTDAALSEPPAFSMALL